MTNKARMWRAGCVLAIAAAVLAAGLVLAAQKAAAQQGRASTRSRLVGTWQLVSAEAEQNGQKVEFFGPHPVGVYAFDADGRYISEVMRGDLPKFASGNRYQGTPEENKAVVQGFIGYFGTYEVQEPDTLILHMAASSYPNFDGTDQKRTIVINGDEMRYSSGGTSFGAVARQVWRRVKPGEKLTK